MIKGRKEKIDYLSFILPKAINVVEKAGFEKPSEKNRDLAKSMKHTSSQAKNLPDTKKTSDLSLCCIKLYYSKKM